MQAMIFSLNTSTNSQPSLQVSVTLATKERSRVSRRKSFLSEDTSTTLPITIGESTTPFTNGILIDGYFIGGANEFDSLTGHPGIRY